MAPGWESRDFAAWNIGPKIENPLGKNPTL